MPITPSTPVPASTDAVSYFLGCHVPAPGSLPPRLFALPDSAQQSLPTQQPYPHLLSGLPVFITVMFLPLLPGFLPSASLFLHLIPYFTPLSSSLGFPCPGKTHPQSLLILLAASPHVLSLMHQGPFPSHCPNWTVSSRDEVPNPRMPQQPAVGMSNIKSKRKIQARPTAKEEKCSL